MGKTEGQGTPIAFSVCEIVDNWLCVNHRTRHIATTGHIQHVIGFLSVRGVRDARRLVRVYGIRAVDSVAQEVDWWEVGGLEWRKDIKNPGAYIHSMIRKAAESDPNEP